MLKFHSRNLVWRQMLFAFLVFLMIPVRDVVVGAARLQNYISAELARAESLYDKAEFESALASLLDLEKRIGNDPKRSGELLRTKLYLGLTYLALNNNPMAKSRFIEVCSLDRKYTLDPAGFSPKVRALFDEARTQCAQSTAKAEGSFEQGRSFYRNGQFLEALKEFTAVLAADGTNEMAREYLKLTEMQLELKSRAAFAEWRSHFGNREFAEAADNYRFLRSLGSLARELAAQVEFEYGNAFRPIIRSWTAACKSGNTTRMLIMRREVAIMASGLELGNDALVEMSSCPRK